MNDETKVLLKEYEILVDLIKHYHTRRHDFNRIVLIINAILISACAVLLRVGTPTIPVSALGFLCGPGILISLLWLLVSQRITIDTDLKYRLLRYIERRLGRDPGIYTFGYKFFFEKKHKRKALNLPDHKDYLEFPKWYEKFRVVSTGWALPLLFIGLYALLWALIPCWS